MAYILPLMVRKVKGLDYRKAKLSEAGISILLLNILTLNLIVTETFKLTFNDSMDV